MKSSLFTFVILTLLIVSCGEEKPEIEQLRDRKDSLIAVIKEIDAEIKEIEEADTTKKKDIQVVYVSPLKKHDFESFVEVNGVVSTDQNIIVTPEFSGTVTRIAVSRGQTVRAGQTLGVLDNKVLRKSLSELETQLELAEKLFGKQERLKAQNVGTEVDWLTAKNRKESIEKSIESVNAQIEKSVVVAPIRGKVDEIFPNVGEMGAPGVPFARIVSTDDIYVEAEISEAYFNKVSAGDNLQVIFPFLKDSVNVKITYKGNFIDPDNRTFKVQASLGSLNKEYPPNLLAIVKVRDAFREDVFTVPSNVVKRDKKGDFVFVVQGKKVQKRRIKLLESYHGETVVSGAKLKEGDKLVVKGYSRIAPEEVVEAR